MACFGGSGGSDNGREKSKKNMCECVRTSTWEQSEFVIWYIVYKLCTATTAWRVKTGVQLLYGYRGQNSPVSHWVEKKSFAQVSLKARDSSTNFYINPFTIRVLIAILL